MTWSKELSEALAVIERELAGGAYLLVAKGAGTRGPLVVSNGSAPELTEHVERWVAAHKATPGRARIDVVASQPCRVCDERHILDEFPRGSFVRIRRDIFIDEVKKRNRSELHQAFFADVKAQLPTLRFKVYEWSQYSCPLYYRIEWVNEHGDTMFYVRPDHPTESIRLSVNPCEIEAEEV